MARSDDGWEVAEGNPDSLKRCDVGTEFKVAARKLWMNA